MNEQGQGYDINKLREYIARCEWKWARTMEEVPHEYIFRGRCALTDEEFYYFLHAQVYHGVEEWWGKRKRPYLYIDGYKYWTMGGYIPENKTMNRQKCFDEFNVLDWPIPCNYSKAEMEIMAFTIVKTFSKKVFEAGIANGDFVRVSGIQPENYYGVDPAKKAVAYFRSRAAGFYQRCSGKSFEEAVAKWKDGQSVVIALFGTASYLMHQYLEKLNETGGDYCLMFYREGYTPDEYKDMHHMGYTKADIQRMFPRANIYNHKKYITASSRPLIWQQPQTPQDLFSDG